MACGIRKAERRAALASGPNEQVASALVASGHEAMDCCRAVALCVRGRCWAATSVAQQARSGQDAYVGEILSRTPEESLAVLGALKSGMDFGVVAKEESVAPTAKDGGYVGRLAATPLPDAERDALKGVRPGQFTGVIALPGGFAVFTLLTSAPKTHDLDVQQMQAVARSAGVRQSIHVAGMSQEDSVFEQFAKPDGWRQDSSEPCAIPKKSHAAAVEHMERVLAVQSEWSRNTAPIDLLGGHVALAQLHAFVGDLD